MDPIYQLVNNFPDRIKDSYGIDVPKVDKKKYRRIIILGMGGCYIAGIVMKEFIRDEVKVPVEVFNGFCSDNEIKNNTLIILLSYSGDTKEVVNFFNRSLLKFHKNIVVITSGGKLSSLSRDNKVNLIEITPNLHQRFTFPYLFFPMLKFLEKSGFIKEKKEVVAKIVKILEKNKKNIELESERVAKNFKNRIRQKYALAYASEYFFPLAYRLQTSIEEDDKMIVHANRITETFHNELEALPDKRFFAILVVDPDEIRDYSGQIKFFKSHIKEYFEFPYFNLSPEERMFLGFYFVDFLGYHISKYRNTPMGDTPLSDKIKKL